MNGRRYMQGPQGGGGYNPYSKYPDISGLVGQFMQNMMMKKQMEQQQRQQMWQRGMEEQKMASTEAYRGAQMEAMQRPQKPPALPARVQEAIAATGQGGVPQEEINWKPVGMKLDEWRAKLEEVEDLVDDKYSQRKNLIKSLKGRLGKEVTGLRQKSKPVKIAIEGEPTPGEMARIQARRKAESQLTNIESALDFIGKMESSLEGGAFGKRQSEALSRMMGNISGLREGTLLDELRASWMEEAKGAPQATQRKQFRNKKTGKLDWFRWDGSKWIKE